MLAVRITDLSNNKDLLSVRCKAVCLAYDTGSVVGSSVSCDGDYPLEGMNLLGCTAAASALKSVTIASNPDEFVQEISYEEECSSEGKLERLDGSVPVKLVVKAEQPSFFQK